MHSPTISHQNLDVTQTLYSTMISISRGMKCFVDFIAKFAIEPQFESLLVSKVSRNLETSRG